MHHQIRRIRFDNVCSAGVTDHVGHVAAEEGRGMGGEVGSASVSKWSVFELVWEVWLVSLLGEGGELFATTNDGYTTLLAFVESFKERRDELADFEEEVFLRGGVEDHYEVSRWN